jgi:arylsulfatase A-like enzyme
MKRAGARGKRLALPRLLLDSRRAARAAYGGKAMRTALRGLVLGLGFGLAVAIADAAVAGIGTLTRRMGPGPGFMLRIALVEIALAGLLGVVVSPLLRVRAGRWLALAALALAWLALGAWVRFEAPMGRMFLVMPPVAGLLLALAGLGIARWRAWPAWALGVALLAAAAGGPQAYVSATSSVPPPLAELPPAPAGAPDVVLVVLDTVRAQNVSAYGYGRDTTPFFGALAREGALFTDATSPATWSLPSHASLFTGRFPTGHGAHGENLVLDGTFPTLADVLARSGYETLCFTSNAWISDGLGLSRGFRFQDSIARELGGAGRNFSFVWRLLDRLGLAEGDKGGATVAARFREWVGARPADARPYFAFLNFIEAHFPYHQLPREYASRYTDRARAELEDVSMALMAQQFGGPVRPLDEVADPARDLYDGGIAYTDELLRRVVEALRARGSLDRTVLVVLADHGETLGERASFCGHGPSLYQEVVSVPLLVRYPPRVPAGARVTTPVSTVGAMATILDLAGVEAPPTLQVGSLAPLAAGAADGGGPVLAENTKMTAMGAPERALADDPQMQGDRRYRALRDGSLKLVETSRGERFLYDLAADPDESRDLAAERPDDVARLAARLEEIRAALGLPALDADLAAGVAPELDPATRERLKQLGYVE